MSNAYQFVTRWRVDGTCGEVADVLGDPTRLAEWWPSVYLDVRELAPPDERGLGRRMEVLTKGWLPYTIRWQFETVAADYPYGFTIAASGDFNGEGVWRFEQNGPSVDITYDWRILAEKPLLRTLSPVLRPLFAANHRWAMRQGEASLRLELARHRAMNDRARAAVPPPPGPVTYTAIGILAAAATIVGTLAFLVRRSRRRSRP